MSLNQSTETLPSTRRSSRYRLITTCRARGLLLTTLYTPSRDVVRMHTAPPIAKCTKEVALPAAEGIYLGLFKGPSDATKELGLGTDESTRVQISIYLNKIKMSSDLQSAVLAKRRREDAESTGATLSDGPAAHPTLNADSTGVGPATPAPISVENEYRSCGGTFEAYKVQTLSHVATPSMSFNPLAAAGCDCRCRNSL